MALLTTSLQYTLSLSAHADEHLDPGLSVISPSKLQTHPANVRAEPLATRSANASEQTLGLEQAIRVAVDWHPSISEAIGTLYQQGENINVAQAGYYPQVTGGIKGGYDSGYDGDRNTQAISISLKQMLYDFGKVDSSVDAARAKAAQSQANILLSIDQVARDTAYAYIEVQRYQNLLETARDQIKGIGDIVQLAQQRSDMGASTRSDVVQAQSRADGGMATLQDYKAQYSRWQTTLANLLGRRSVPQVNDGFSPGLNQSCQAADNGDALPAVLAAVAQRTQAQAELANAKAQAYPTLSLEPSLNQYLDNDYNKDNPDINRTQVGIFLNLEVPIYQGGATSARSRAAGHALSAADSAEDAARLQARQGLTEAQAQTASLNRRLSALQTRESSISQARELYGKQYLELGTRPLLDLLNAEQEIYQSRFDLENTVADMRRLQIDCLYNSGGLRRAFGIEHSTIQHVEILP
ncbi:TolC family type I secretion outer membrane protein [Pseudomonas sp. M47T1]|nr:TolC family type I secretion outer membrane protein [Pseudomonas sp. M47T1]